MFTGIIQAVGKIESVTPQGKDENAGLRFFQIDVICVVQSGCFIQTFM